ncbi:MAG: stage II sporulation protein R [Clostridiales bacterium]|jgi:stage II sporulation protein R|nr:stage II sporulation protein R [Clostridiales bacterium]
MLKKLRKELIIIAVSLLIGTAAALISSFMYSEKVQAGIANSVIRFHVLANSDSMSDQNLKLAVRDRILEEYSAQLGGGNSLEQSREFLLGNLQEIKTCAEEVLRANGSGDSVSVSLGKTFFPTKTYGDIAFPAGNYEALKIEIGEAAGQNWWCVMFPPLCFVDITHSATTDELKTDLAEILTNEEYDIVVKAKAEELFPVKIKFKVVEFWQEIQQPEMYAKK